MDGPSVPPPAPGDSDHRVLAIVVPFASSANVASNRSGSPRAGAASDNAAPDSSNNRAAGLGMNAADAMDM